MVETTVYQILGLIVSTLFGALMMYLKNLKKDRKSERKKYDDLTDTLFTMVKSQIVGEWSRLSTQGFVYLHDLEAINALNGRYTAMGGNGMVKLLMLDIEKLPRKTTKHNIYEHEHDDSGKVKYDTE